MPEGRETVIEQLREEMLEYCRDDENRAEWPEADTVRDWADRWLALVASSPAPLTDVERYDHATAVHRGEELNRLHAFLVAVTEHSGLRAAKVAVEANRGARVTFGYDPATAEYVLPARFSSLGSSGGIVHRRIEQEERNEDRGTRVDEGQPRRIAPTGSTAAGNRR